MEREYIAHHIRREDSGLLHVEREYIAYHIRREDSGLEHLIASSHPKKYSKDYLKCSKDSKPEQRNPEAPESAR